MPRAGEQGSLLLGALLLMVVLSMMAAMLARHLESGARTVAEHAGGQQAYTLALTGLELAAYWMRQQDCTIAGGVATITRSIEEETGQQYGQIVATISQTGSYRYSITSSATPTGGLYQSGMTASGLCTPKSTAQDKGNLFADANANSWSQSHLVDVAHNSATFTGKGYGPVNNDMACMEDVTTTACLSNSHIDNTVINPISLPMRENAVVWFISKLSPQATSGRFTMRLGMADGSMIMCGSLGGTESNFGLRLDRSGMGYCRNSATLVDTFNGYNPEEQQLIFYLGNIDPSAIKTIRFRIMDMSLGSQLTLEDACLGGLTCSPVAVGTSGGQLNPRFTWDAGTWRLLE